MVTRTCRWLHAAGGQAGGPPPPGQHARGEATRDEALTKATWDISITKGIGQHAHQRGAHAADLPERGQGCHPATSPKGLQSFIRPIILFVRDDVAKPNIGPKYGKFMPFLPWSSSSSDRQPDGADHIAPFGANVTGSISVTLRPGGLHLPISCYYGNRQLPMGPHPALGCPNRCC